VGCGLWLLALSLALALAWYCVELLLVNKHARPRFASLPIPNGQPSTGHNINPLNHPTPPHPHDNPQPPQTPDPTPTPTPTQDGGSITAGNSSPISDGACALVLASAERARRERLPVLAVVRGYGDANQEPEWFTTAPAAAIPKVGFDD